MKFPVFLICLVFIPPCLSNFDGYTSCGKQFNCGSITDVDYPFWGQDRPYGCGYPGLQLNCDEHDAATIDIMKVKYRVLGINPNTQTLKIAREDYMEGICPSQFVNTTLDFTLFDYAPGYMNLTIFYGCSPVSNAIFDGFSPCVVKGFPYGGIYVLSGVHGPGNCNTSVFVPVSQVGMSELGFAFANFSGLDQLLRDGFEVKWKVDGKPCSECTKSMGKCGYYLNLNQTSCFCPNQIDGLTTCLPSPAAGATIPDT